MAVARSNSLICDLSIFASQSCHCDSGVIRITVYSRGKSLLVLLFSSYSLMATNRKFMKFDNVKEKAWEKPFVFIQAADPQFGMIDSYLLHKPEPRWDEEKRLTNKAVEAANKMVPMPRFFVVCGDLVDAFPGLSVKREQENDFKQIFAKLKPEIPLVCICGNHDIGNQPTVESVQSFRRTFGDDYFAFLCGGVKFIALNSQYYEDSSLVPELAKEQELWLDDQLAEAKREKYRHTIIFQHIPWFLRSPSEAKEYFNIEAQLRLKYLEKFRCAGVRTIFCGHYHRNAGGFYYDTEVVTTSAIGAQLGNDLSGLRVVQVLEDTVEHRYHDLEHVPTHINLSSL